MARKVQHIVRFAGQKMCLLQGFCCTCSAGNTFDAFGQRTRAGNLCQNNMPTAGHCLRPSGALWELSTIRSQEMEYTLKVTVNTSLATLSNLGSNTVTALTLSEGQPGKVAADNAVSARILGGLASYFPFPNLSGSKAFFRKVLSTTFVHASTDLMILPDNMVSVYGNVCNKVGTSFEAFRCVCPALLLSDHASLPPQVAKIYVLAFRTSLFGHAIARFLARLVALLLPGCHVLIWRVHSVVDTYTHCISVPTGIKLCIHVPALKGHACRTNCTILLPKTVTVSRMDSSSFTWHSAMHK
jgi:Male gamete fusion factor